MKKFTIILILLIALMITNCIPVPIIYGSIYSNYTDNNTIINKDSSAKEGIGTKRGESCAYSILLAVALGDAGIKAAAQNGGIINVRSMDIKYTNILGTLFTSKCTIVYGD